MVVLRLEQMGNIVAVIIGGFQLRSCTICTLCGLAHSTKFCWALSDQKETSYLAKTKSQTKRAYKHGQLGISLAFPPYYVWGQILVSTKGPTCRLYKTELVLFYLPKISSMDAEMRSASWQCQQATVLTTPQKNKRRCSLCRV